jgi:hypothetical protein
MQLDFGKSQTSKQYMDVIGQFHVQTALSSRESLWSSKARRLGTQSGLTQRRKSLQPAINTISSFHGDTICNEIITSVPSEAVSITPCKH